MIYINKNYGDKFKKYLMRMNILPACMSVNYVCVVPEEGGSSDKSYRWL